MPVRSRASVQLRRLAAAVATASMIAVSLVSVGLGVAASPAQATHPTPAALQCTPDTIYGTAGDGSVHAIDVGTGATSRVTSVAPANNGLGISDGGARAFAMQNGGNGTIVAYDAASGDTTTYSMADATAPSTIIRGAINPVNGVYYYGGGGTTAYIGAFDAEDGTPIGQVGQLTDLPTGNGDFAFSSTGTLFVVGANQVRRVDAALPTTPGATSLATTLVATLPTTVDSPGIAFGNDGSLYVSNGGTLIELDPSSGAQLSSTSIGAGLSPTDLASCSYPNTLTIVKDVTDRFHPADQFGLSVTGGTIQTGNVGTTAGGATGVQPQQAGPVFADAGTTYLFGESAVGTASLSNYTSSVACVERNSGRTVPVTPAGSSWRIVYPQASGSTGSDVLCTITNDALEPGFEIAKTADPASGTSIDPGSTVTYSVTATNTGETALGDVQVRDDLAGVLTHADYADDAVATIGGEDAGSVVVDGDELSWSGDLAIGETVTIRYSVTVHADAAGTTITNLATGEATPPGGETITPPPVSTEHPVNEPGFELGKTADPESGTAVDPGATIHYTLTGANTGQTSLSDVALTDDLSGVTEHADYAGDAVATIDGEDAGAVTLDGDELSWTGDLAVGETVTVTYSVTVHGDAGGTTIGNSVTGSATPPGGETITPPPSTTEHAVNEPGFELGKTADPESGTAVDPGATIHYALTGANTGQTSLSDVTLTDDLSGVTEHADYAGDAVATIDGEDAGAVTLDGDELSWTGSLAVGETVTVTYSVTVHGDAGGATIGNSVTGSATPPGGETITPPPSTTEHPVNEPGFELSKTADPESGSHVEVDDVITYTVTGANTGQTVLDPVVITDDLTGVLDAASYRQDAVATIDGEDAGDVALSGQQLVWTGTLEVGQTVTITYSVTVSGDAGGQTIGNVVNAEATPPGGSTITPPPAETTHVVDTPPAGAVPPTSEDGLTPTPSSDLPQTGLDLAWPWMLGAAILLLTLGAVMLAGRRRSAE